MFWESMVYFAFWMIKVARTVWIVLAHLIFEGERWWWRGIYNRRTSWSWQGLDERGTTSNVTQYSSPNVQYSKYSILHKPQPQQRLDERGRFSWNLELNPTQYSSQYSQYSLSSAQAQLNIPLNISNMSNTSWPRQGLDERGRSSTRTSYSTQYSSAIYPTYPIPHDLDNILLQLLFNIQHFQASKSNKYSTPAIIK